MNAVLEALDAETQRTGAWLATLGEADLQRPTRCPPLSVTELAAHAWRGSKRVVEMIQAGPVDSEPEKDGVTYFQYDAVAEGPQIVARAQEAAAKEVSGPIAEVWKNDWAQAIDAARGTLQKHDPVFQTVFGLMKLSEYLRTRVLEVTIHTMDLRDALDLGPDPTPAALTSTCDILRGLLGTDQRPLGIDDVRFALIGTGRGALNGPEQVALGPLAERFPLLA